MERIQIGEREVLVGLDWQDLAKDVSERSALARVLKNPIHKGKRYGVMVSGPDERAVGLAPANAKLQGKIPSAAAWLARAAQVRMHSGGGDSEAATTDAQSWNWVVIEKIDEELYWMVAIYKGIPMATTDIMGSFETVIHQSQAFQQTGEFTVHSSDSQIRDTLAFNGAVTDQGFSQLIDSVPAGDIRSSELLLRQVAGLRLPLFLGAVGMLFVVGALIVGVHLHRQHLAEAARAKAAAAAAANQREIAQARTKYGSDVQVAVYKALDAGKKQVDVILASPAPSLVVDQWTNLVEQVNLDQATWDLSGIHCEAGSTPVCVVKLTRGALGVNRLLLVEHPDANITGDTATYTLTGSVLGKRAANWSRLADARSFMVDLISDLQLLRNAGIEYHQDASKEVVRNVDMPKTTSQKFKPGSTEKVGPPPVVQLGIATGKMGLGSQSLWQLKGLAEFLDHDGIVLKDLDVSLASDGVKGWKMNAEYIIRSKPQPLLPTIMVEGQPLPLSLPASYAEVHQATGGVGGSDGAPAVLAPAPDANPVDGAPSPLGLPPPPPAIPSAPPLAVPSPVQNF